MTDDSRSQGCIGEAAMEEYAVQAVIGDALPQPLSAHLETCAPCRREFEQMKRAAAALREALARDSHPQSPECLDDEILARYIDKSLTSADTRAATIHLARCATCRRRMVDIHKGLSTIELDESLPQPSPLSEHTPTSAGAPETDVSAPVEKSRNDAKSTESRKGRYSSGSC